VVGHVLLGVPEVEVAGAALKVDHDDAFGLAPAGTAGVGVLGLGLELEHRAQAEAEQARTADAQEVAAGHAEVGVAEVFARLTGDDDHDEAPWEAGCTL